MQIAAPVPLTFERILKVSVADPVPLGLLALSVTALVTAAVGVPEITPLLVFTDKPASGFVRSFR